MQEAIIPPLSVLEENLKLVLLRHPDMQNKVPTSSELAEYIIWMAEQFNSPVTYESLQLDKKSVTDSALTVLADKNCNAAVTQFEQMLDCHSEGNFFPAGRDISADIMTRYLPSHWHTSCFFEVYYSIHGDCPISFQDETVILHTGSVLIVAPSVVHASPCFADDRVLVYYLIRVSTFNDIFWSQLKEDNLLTSFFRHALIGKLTSSYLQFDTQCDQDIRSLFQMIYKECHEDERYASTICNSMMNMVFSLLLRRYEGTVRLPRTPDFYWRQEFSAILSYLQTHFATTNIEELSAHFHYSRRQINRIIQNCMGMSYKELSTKLRMDRSQTLLREGTLTVNEIAQQLGYASVSSFHRAFTRYYGFTPGEFVTREL